MNPVNERPFLPQVVPQTLNGIFATVSELIRRLVELFSEFAFRINKVLPMDGTEPMTGPLMLATFTVATRPTASSWTGSIIFVSDGAAGAKFQGSDGTNWVNLG